MADITFTAASIKPLLQTAIKPVAAAEALGVGDAIYIDSSGKAALADADAAASAQVRGVVVAIRAYGKLAAVANETVDVCFYGPVTGFSSLTPGALLYASTVAGNIEAAAPAGSSGDYLWIVGFCYDASTIFVAPFTTDTAAQ